MKTMTLHCCSCCSVAVVVGLIVGSCCCRFIRSFVSLNVSQFVSCCRCIELHTMLLYEATATEMAMATTASSNGNGPPLIKGCCR
jgi:multisubunit Na+/H+ antiporter MnhE subunit